MGELARWLRRGPPFKRDSWRLILRSKVGGWGRGFRCWQQNFSPRKYQEPPHPVPARARLLLHETLSRSVARSYWPLSQDWAFQAPSYIFDLCDRQVKNFVLNDLRAATMRASATGIQTKSIKVPKSKAA